MNAHVAPPVHEVERAFAEAMARAGFMPRTIEADTAGFVRFDAPGDKAGRQNGFYKLKTGRYPVGWFGDWKGGEQHQWQFDDGRELTIKEREEIKAEHRRLKMEAQVDRETKQAEVAESAARIWSASSPAKQHPYLEKKGIEHPLGLRTRDANDGTRLLVVPMWSFGMDGQPTLTNLQHIGPDGSKRFMGGGRVGGTFFSLAGDAATILICEGVATGFSLWKATGFSVVCAFNSGNLIDVAKQIRRARDAQLLICADDDAIQPDDWEERGNGKAWVNTGVEKAAAAADAIQAKWIKPVFSGGPARGRTDFNDLATHEGAAMVDRQVRDAFRAPVPATEQKPPASPDPSEDAVATAFTQAYADRLKYDHQLGSWFEWIGTHWQRDDCRRAFHFARLMAAQMGKGRAKVSKSAFAAGVERFAQADPAHSIKSEVWDADDFLLGTPAGVVDLRTGKKRDAKPGDMISKLTSVAPEQGEPTRWLQFLHEATGGDPTFIRYIQQMLGYALTGDTREQVLFFVFGPGKNGKSVLVNVASKIMGDYAVKSAMETFASTKHERHSTELARLHGARMVWASETEEGRAWAEARIKEITGGEPITARFMRQDFFEFVPKLKLLIIGNHQPALHNVDAALRRRFNMLPFEHTPANPDPQLEDKLKDEHGRILGWMIAGCLDWQRNGLMRPKAVGSATEDYFAEQDIMAQWIEDTCVVGPNEREFPARLFGSWVKYATAAGESAGTMKSFSATLQKRHFTKVKLGGVRFYKGLILRQENQPSGSPAEPRDRDDGPIGFGYD